MFITYFQITDRNVEKKHNPSNDESPKIFWDPPFSSLIYQDKRTIKLFQQDSMQ